MTLVPPPPDLGVYVAPADFKAAAVFDVLFFQDFLRSAFVGLANYITSLYLLYHCNNQMETCGGGQNKSTKPRIVSIIVLFQMHKQAN